MAETTIDTSGRVSAQHYALAKERMQRARRAKAHNDARSVRFWVAEARREFRTAQTWRLALEHPPREPWPDAEFAALRRAGIIRTHPPTLIPSPTMRPRP